MPTKTTTPAPLNKGQLACLADHVIASVERFMAEQKASTDSDAAKRAMTSGHLKARLLGVIGALCGPAAEARLSNAVGHQFDANYTHGATLRSIVLMDAAEATRRRKQHTIARRNARATRRPSPAVMRPARHTEYSHPKD